MCADLNGGASAHELADQAPVLAVHCQSLDKVAVLLLGPAAGLFADGDGLGRTALFRFVRVRAALRPHLLVLLDLSASLDSRFSRGNGKGAEVRLAQGHGGLHRAQ